MKPSSITLCLALVLAAAACAAEDFTGTGESRLGHGGLGNPKAKSVFVKDKEEVRVSLCDHCFDIGQKTCKTPPEFYQLYTAYVKEGPAADEANAPDKSTKAEPEFTHVVVKSTLYYKGGPQQAQPPDGTFTAGTKVRLLRAAGSYSRVRSEGGIEGYVAAKAIAARLVFDPYSGYFVSNKFEPDQAASFVVIGDQKRFDEVFGVAFVMGDKSHRLPKDAFKSLMVLAAIKRGQAYWEFKVEGITVNEAVVELRYTATSKKSDSAIFACPLIVSIPKGKYTAVAFVENGKVVKKMEIGEK